MRALALEVRDNCTFIPVLAVSMVARTNLDGYLLGRAGYGTEKCVVLTKLSPSHGDIAAYDPYDWPASSRTMRVAHAYIEEYWADLSDGDVIDVELILGETTVKKLSERFDL